MLQLAQRDPQLIDIIRLLFLPLLLNDLLDLLLIFLLLLALVYLINYNLLQLACDST